MIGSIQNNTSNEDNLSNDFYEIYSKLDFLSKSIRLQYTNFLAQCWNKNKISFDEILIRIKKNEPIEYILNLAQFYDKEFYVDRRCLIPRPETKELIDLTLEYIQTSQLDEFSIIDIGTGSGCIILTLAEYLGTKPIDKDRSQNTDANLPRFKSNVSKVKSFIGIDISSDALEVAKINREKLNLNAEVELQLCDFRNYDFSQYSNLVVCANLPYIPNTDKLQPSVYDYEPHIALFGGEKGSELNTLLINILKDYNNRYKNIRALFMEGYDGEITSHKF